VDERTGTTLFKFVEMEIWMNKKLMALAVAAAVSAPALALADDSTVAIYGTLNVDFENVKAEGCTSAPAPAAPCATDIKQRNRVSSNTSNIGFRGLEPLMPGLNAWFQVESQVNLDNAGTTWASRNSAVGLNGDFGSVLLGQWDSPYKFSTLRLDPFGDTTIGAYDGIMGGGVGGTTAGNSIAPGAASKSFDRRVSNTLQYWTPNWSGFSGRLAYGANEEKNASGSLDPRLFALSASYENGPLYLTAAYEEHRDFASIVAAQGKDTGLKIGGAYTFASVFTLGLTAEKLKYQSDGAVTPLFNRREVIDYFVTGTYKLGPNAFSLVYGHKGKDKLGGTPVVAGANTDGDQDNTEAKLFGFRYGYSLSKRTEFYASFVKIDNESASAVDFGNNAIGTATGADPQGVAVGFIHKF
jgi:predicted porin